uniref:AC4 n=2 Tax=Squash leaf curl virus TaxID=10829 RepID=A0A089NF36_SLCV|nr:AC4 [Squash leaf curl virus]AIQ86471.1 AC4 [Squash leaf curl virus]AIQ86474.1 AC4 [Squash leaf curl virus]AIQ86478.1 AC4 [Squash leaf curl virus]AIQ86507.1 AC4 [Squash leaf curl virus]
MFPKKKFLRCFCISRGQSSNRITLESPERNIPTGLRTYTASFNYLENPTSRMLDYFSTSLTPDGLPDFTRTFRLPKTPTPSRTTSPKKVIIVNPGNIKCLGVQSRTKTTYITTPSMQVVREKLSKL